jgi:hypothetical protein
MSSHTKIFLCRYFPLQGIDKSQLVRGQVNKVSGWWPHCDSQQNTWLSWQNEQMHCYVKGTNCLSLKIVAPLSKSDSNFLAPVCWIQYLLLFLQAQFFLNHTLFIKESNHHHSEPWFLPAKLYGPWWWYYSPLEDTYTGKKVKTGNYE